MSDSMQVCESCGTKFPPSNEVMSSRILCPACAEKRRAALRAAKQAATAGPAAVNPSASAPAAPGKGAVVSQPAAAPAPAPAMRVSRPARTAAAATAVRREAEDTKPAPRGGREHHRSPEEHLDVRKMKAQEQARMVKIGWGVTGGVALIVAIVLLIVSNKQTERQQGIEATQKWLADTKRYFETVDPNSESALNAAKERFKNDRKLIRGTNIESDVNAAMTKINGSLQMLVKTRSLKEQLEGIEKQLAASPTAETLARLFVSARDPEITQQANEFTDLKPRHTSLVKSVSDQYITSLRAAATAAAGSTTGEALAPYGALEDTLRTVVEEAGAATDTETVQKYEPVYRQVVGEINEIVAKLFDDAYIQRVPSKNLLEDPAGWTPIETSSFTHKFGGGLTLANAPGETSESGGLTYTAGRVWRDYVIDMEVTLESGELVFYTRIGDKMDTKAVPGFTLGLKNTNVLAEPKKAYKIQVRVIGKEFTVLVDGAGQQHGEELTIRKSRKGEPGVVAKAGTNAVISSFRVKHLR